MAIENATAYILPILFLLWENIKRLLFEIDESL